MIWNFREQDRLAAWKQFREGLLFLTEDEIITEVNKFWNTAPLSNQYYSQDLPEQFPGPWQLIVDNFYDDIAKGLGIYYTILLTNRFSDIRFQCFRRTNPYKEYNLVNVAGKYLNLTLSVENTVNTDGFIIIHDYKIPNK